MCCYLIILIWNFVVFHSGVHFSLVLLFEMVVCFLLFLILFRVAKNLTLLKTFVFCAMRHLPSAPIKISFDLMKTEWQWFLLKGDKDHTKRVHGFTLFFIFVKFKPNIWFPNAFVNQSENLLIDIKILLNTLFVFGKIHFSSSINLTLKQCRAYSNPQSKLTCSVRKKVFWCKMPSSRWIIDLKRSKNKNTDQLVLYQLETINIIYLFSVNK